MPAFSTAERYDPKWYAAADTSGCIRRVIALYDRSFFCLWSFLIALRISGLSQTMLRRRIAPPVARGWRNRRGKVTVPGRFPQPGKFRHDVLTSRQAESFT